MKNSVRALEITGIISLFGSLSTKHSEKSCRTEEQNDPGEKGASPKEPLCTCIKPEGVSTHTHKPNPKLKKAEDKGDTG